MIKANKRHSGNWMIILVVLGWAWMQQDTPTSPTSTPVATTEPVIEIELNP